MIQNPRSDTFMLVSVAVMITSLRIKRRLENMPIMMSLVCEVGLFSSPFPHTMNVYYESLKINNKEYIKLAEDVA
jgi:hypothetical protein